MTPADRSPPGATGALKTGPYGDQYDPDDGIAIVGMAGRFPGANSVQALWRNVVEGVDSISRFDPETLENSFREDMLARREPGYVCARGVLDDADCFDEAFFGFTPAEAALLDPQHRLFLQAAWEALEHAGHDPQAFAGLIGVFAGGTANSYYLNNLQSRPEVTDKLGLLTTQMANQGHYIATRAAYKLNLRGPALNIQTACSTSLVAVCTAVNSLQSYQCDMALAGGVSVTLPQRRGYLHQEGSILSPDGVCRAFDAEAAGTVFSNGLGIVVLRRLADALQDGDTIYAVIKGAALNNDGHDKLSFTAPSVQGQAEVISTAQALAGIDPHTISYVEAHGTGTSLGDPIEVAALTQAFKAGGATEPASCALASLKTQIGHLDAAAGVAGLIRTALALHHRVLPASLHFTQPNPKLQLDASPFYVNDRVRPWPEGPTLRRAGVSSFGVGGTNAHVVLEEAPVRVGSGLADAFTDADSTPAAQLLVVSARDEAALERSTQQLRTHLAGLADDAGVGAAKASLADTAYTLQSGRRAFAYRRAWVGRSAADLLQKMAEPQSRPLAARDGLKLAFLFPGQGSQYLHAGRGLYATEAVFRAELDACAEVLREPMGCDLRTVLFPSPGAEDAAAEQLAQTGFTQPVLLALQLALARQWLSWGVQPAALLGHSLGEYAAACIGGTFSRDDVLLLVAHRARLMQQLPPGAMLAVRAAPQDLQAEWVQGVDLAAVNAPRALVLAGPEADIEPVEGHLNARGLVHRRLGSSRAFHSSMMDAMLPEFEAHLRRVPFKPPHTPWISGVTGELITDEQACSPAYWLRQLREPVQFSKALATCLEGVDALLEVGPGDTLINFASQQAGAAKLAVKAASLPSRLKDQSTPGLADGDQMLRAAGQLWCAGQSLDWPKLRRQPAHRVPLPTYPFARNRHWVDAAPVQDFPVLSAALPLATEAAARPPEAQPQTGCKETAMAVSATPSTPTRRAALMARLQVLFADLAGVEAASLDPAVQLLEMGLDSLILTQASQSLGKAFGVKVPMRLLLEELTTLDALADHLDAVLPQAVAAPRAPPASPSATTSMVAQPHPQLQPQRQPKPQLQASAAPMLTPAPSAATVLMPAADLQVASQPWMALFSQQLSLMSQQLQMIHQGQVLPPASWPDATPATDLSEREAQLPVPTPPPATAPLPAFGPYRPPLRRGQSGSILELSARQKQNLDDFIARYNAHTAGSKQRTAQTRRALADPRSVAGFRQLWKELVYPLVTVGSEGSRLWDVDGHNYIDITNGFGMILFGHNPPFVREALEQQLSQGYEIGPQTPLAGEVAQALCEMVGLERAAFCATGSEAVMAAIRLARTVTARDRIVIFAGAYHGIFDEVLVRPARADSGRALPIAPGIPQAMAENIVVLEYGSEQSLRAIEAMGAEVAAVLVEPVQSRRPELQPREFLQKLRAITSTQGSALIFDEVVTGFRVHPGGAQAVFGVKADLATYGKVLGGGMPIGVVAGSARFMDALDGGEWQYGDASAPEVGVTFFAGTFVRHPLALAAAKAVLERLRNAGPDLQKQLNARAEHLVRSLQAEADLLNVPLRINHFASWFHFHWAPEVSLAPMFYAAMRMRGIHVWEGRPCFITTAHTDEDLQSVLAAFKASLEEMKVSGFLGEIAESEEANPSSAVQPRDEQLPLPSQPPVVGARLGRDNRGREAWFVPDPERAGKYLQVVDNSLQHG